MRIVRVMNRSRGMELAREAWVADTRWTRLRGLLGRSPLRRGEGLILMPCRGVHTWGMRYPIDVVLVADGGRVTAVYPDLEPWRRTRFHRDARTALEVPRGTIEATNTRPGDWVRVVRDQRGAAGERASSPGGGG